MEEVGEAAVVVDLERDAPVGAPGQLGEQGVRLGLAHARERAASRAVSTPRRLAARAKTACSCAARARTLPRAAEAAAPRG